MQKNILLVDDESSLRRSLFLGLSQEGYTVEPCENGVNAIRKLHLYKNNDINLDTVVLDIQLPDIDGIKLGKIIKSKYPDTNIIFISGYSDRFDSVEIQGLGDSKLLEKPFTVQDLTIKIEEICREHALTAKEPKKETVTDVPKIKTHSAYAMLKLDKSADFFSIFRKLYFDKNVLYCDATNGDFDIFLLLQSDSIESCKEICDNHIRNMEGVIYMEFLPVSNPVLDDSLKNLLNVFSIESSNFQVREIRNRVSSYVLVEIEREKLEEIYPALYFDDNVVYCDYTDSKYNIVLLVQGTQFTEIDKFIKNKVSTLDGVLKVKEYPIVTIFEM